MAGYKVLSDYTFTIEKETSYGVPVASAPIGLPTESMEFNIESNKHRLNRAWGYRGQHEANSWNDTFGVVPSATVNFIMTPQLMTLVLPGILQKSTSWTPAANVYTMYTNNYADLPLIKGSNEGYFYTLVRNSPKALDDERITSAVPSTLKLSVGPTDNEGILMGEWEFLGSEYDRGLTVSGTVSHAALTDMYKWGELNAVTYSGYTLTSDFVSMELNVTNGLKKVSDLPDGEFVMPKWEVTGTLKVIANANTEAMKTLVLNTDVSQGAELKIAFGTSSTTPAANGDLILTSFCYLTGWSSDYAEGEVIDFTFEGVFGGGANEYPLQAKFYYL